MNFTPPSSIAVRSSLTQSFFSLIRLLTTETSDSFILVSVKVTDYMRI